MEHIGTNKVKLKYNVCLHKWTARKFSMFLRLPSRLCHGKVYKTFSF